MATRWGGPTRPSPPGTVVRVRLLGGVALEVAGEQVALKSARAESLLAYLLLHREAPQQRRHLAFTLWPDSTESQALTNLRHLLHNLRRALPDADRLIEAGPRTLRWAAEAPLRLDVDEFERAVSEGRLEDAVRAYGGDLVEGSYDEWLLEERERLAQLHLEALEGLARTLEAEGRPAEAIRHAERLLARDPLREDAYRLLMRLHDAAGDRARALRTYHQCATTLVRELGVEPSAATREDYEVLLAADSTPVPGADERPAEATPLIGRREERARLAALWRSVEGGGAQLALITGEPGVGKSRLVEELRSWCSHRGVVTAEARAYAAEGEIAYGGLVAWLRSEPIQVRLEQVEPAHLTELTRLLPELSAVPGIGAPEPLPPAEQRRRLFAAAREAIFEPRRAMLLVADDVQWCDVETLQFVHYLLRTAPEARVLVAATARREELEERPRASEVVAGLGELGMMTELALGRLGREDTAVLSERIVGRPLATDEAERLYEQSEGNPLFLLEAARAEPGGVAATDVSERVHALIASRLARLSEPAAELLGVAATIGREFTAPLLAEAGEADEDRLVRALDELWRAGIVRARDPTGYDFSHGKIRDVAYEAMSPAQRRHNHLRVAEVLARRRVEGSEAASARIAAHYDASGAVHDAVDWYRRAAADAQRLAASVDAVRALDRGLELIRSLERGRERDALEVDLLTRLPAPLVAVEGYLSDRVAGVHARALELVADLGVDPEPPLDRSLALATLTRGEFEAARPYGERLRAHAERSGDDVLWVESAYVLAIASYWQGRLADARREFEAALARYRPQDRAEHLLRYGQDPQVFCAMRLAHTLWLLGDDEGSERARMKALDSAREVGHPYSRGGALVFAIILALDRGDEERFREHTEELCSDEILAQARPMRSGAEAFAGYVELLDGRADAGADRVEAAYASARAAGAAAPGHLGFLARLRVAALVGAGRASSAVAAADEALAIGGGVELWEAEVRRLRARALAASGADLPAPEAELRRAIEAAERQRARPFAQRARADLERLPGGTR